MWPGSVSLELVLTQHDVGVTVGTYIRPRLSYSGSGCSTVVEYMPNDWEVVGFNPVGYRAFFPFSCSFFKGCPGREQTWDHFVLIYFFSQAAPYSAIVPSSLSCVSFQQQKRSLTERQHYKNGSKDGCLRANLEAQQTIPAHNLKKISFSGYDPIPELFGTHVDDVDVFREPVEDSADRGRVEEGHRRPQNPWGKKFRN